MHLKVEFTFLSAKTKAKDDKKDAGANAVVSLSLKFRQSKKMKDLINSNVVFISTSGISLEEPEDEEPDNDTGGTSGGGNGNDNGDNPL